MSSIRVEVEGSTIVVTFNGPATDAEFESYLAQMTKLLVELPTPLATILDATRAGATPPKQRERQGSWLKLNAPILRRKSAGTAFVITSPLVRGILTAIFWIAKPPNAWIIVETLVEARAWTNAQLRAWTGERDGTGLR